MLLLKLGLHGVVDHGEGIIFPAEPNQGFALSNKFVEVLDQVDNPFRSDKSTGKQVRSVQYGQLVAYIRKLSTTEKKQQEMYKLLGSNKISTANKEGVVLGLFSDEQAIFTIPFIDRVLGDLDKDGDSSNPVMARLANVAVRKFLLKYRDHDYPNYSIDNPIVKMIQGYNQIHAKRILEKLDRLFVHFVLANDSVILENLRLVRDNPQTNHIVELTLQHLIEEQGLEGEAQELRSQLDHG